MELYSMKMPDLEKLKKLQLEEKQQQEHSDGFLHNLLKEVTVIL